MRLGLVPSDMPKGGGHRAVGTGSHNVGRRRSPRTSSKNMTLVFMGNMTSPNVTIRRTGVGKTDGRPASVYL